MKYLDIPQKSFYVRTKEYVINAIIFTIIFVFAVAVSTQALARKVNSFQTITSPIFFTVDKQDVVVSSVVEGRVEDVLVSPGQHVKEGELIVTIDSTLFDRKVEALEVAAVDNLSAKTELSVLAENRSGFEVAAPIDGVLYEVDAAPGTYLNKNSKVFTIFSDRDARLVSYVTPAQHSELQGNSSLSVYSQRLEQVFEVTLDGIGRVTNDPNDNSGGGDGDRSGKYELIFRFVNPEDGAVFIEQESLQLVTVEDDDTILRPMDRITNLWNALILGRQE